MVVLLGGMRPVMYLLFRNYNFLRLIVLRTISIVNKY